MRPVNLEEWNALPIWRSHVNHQLGYQAGCRTAAQRRLREAGISCMGDLVDTQGRLLPWNVLQARGIPMQGTLQDLHANLRASPELDTTPR